MHDMNSKRKSGIKRHQVSGDRDSSFTFFAHKDLVCRQYAVKIIDFSVIGFGIETEHPLEPGLIWLNEPFCGNKGGFVVWCVPANSRYRAGIEFASFGPKEEAYIQRQIELLRESKPLGELKRLIAIMNNYYAAYSDPAKKNYPK